MRSGLEREFHSTQKPRRNLDQRTQGGLQISAGHQNVHAPPSSPLRAIFQQGVTKTGNDSKMNAALVFASLPGRMDAFPSARPFCPYMPPVTRFRLGKPAQVMATTIGRYAARKSVQLPFPALLLTLAQAWSAVPWQSEISATTEHRRPRPVQMPGALSNGREYLGRFGQGRTRC